MWHAAALGLLWFAATSPAPAAQVHDMQVSHQGNTYHVHARVALTISPAQAYAAATDFERLPQYNPSIIKSERIGSDELKSTMRLCALWYCKTLRQVMRYRLTPASAIDMTVVPGAGDLRGGSAHWRFAASSAAHTQMLFDATVIPAFWIPPLIGPLVIGHALRQQVQTTADSIERLAGADDAGSPDSQRRAGTPP